MARVSIIMGVYNEKNHRQVKEAVESILQQSYRDFEFIICDDGSPEAESRWLASYCKQDERIRYCRLEHNRGLSAALNKCLEMCEGEYVARMDADDISLPQRLERQVDFLDEHPEYALVGCSVSFIEKDKIWGKRHPPECPQPKDFLKTSPFIHPTILIRTQILKKLGGYSEAPMALRVEDYDLFLRLYAAGERGYNLQDILFHYREDRDSFGRRKYRYRINEMRIRRKGFQELGICSGNMRYVVKPLVVGLVPVWLARRLRSRKFE